MFLVTGATGNVGSQVVKQLVAGGHAVRILVRDPAKARLLAAPGVEVAVGDFLQPATLDRALEGVQKAFLLSSIEQQQVEMQGNFIEAAQRAGTLHVVKGSAIGADLNSPVGYLRWHAETEQQLAMSGLGFTHIRPHVFMQQAFDFAPTIAAQGMMYGPVSKTARVSTVDVRDIAAVVVGALTGTGHEGKTYTVTGPAALSYDDMAAAIGAVVGKPVTYVPLPSREAAKGMLMQFGTPDWRAEDIVTMCELFDNGDFAHVTDTVEQIGQKPPISFAQFVRDYAHVFQGGG